MIWTGCNCRDAHLFCALSLVLCALFFLLPDFSSPRLLRVLCVSAVMIWRALFNRRDAEYAAEAQRSN
jgi:hypothetical protein